MTQALFDLGLPRPLSSTRSAASRRSRSSSASGRCGASSSPSGSTTRCRASRPRRDPERLADAGADAAAVGLELARGLYEAAQDARRGRLRHPAVQGARGGARSAHDRRRSRSVRLGHEGRDARVPRPRVGEAGDRRERGERLCRRRSRPALAGDDPKHEGRREFAGSTRRRLRVSGRGTWSGCWATRRSCETGAKIEAAIANAGAVVALRDAELPFPALVWSLPAGCFGSAGGRRHPGGDPRVPGAREGAQAARLPVRRPDDRVRADAGLRAVNDHIAVCYTVEVDPAGRGARAPRIRGKPARLGAQSGAFVTDM